MFDVISNFIRINQTNISALPPQMQRAGSNLCREKTNKSFFEISHQIQKLENQQKLAEKAITKQDSHVAH